MLKADKIPEGNKISNTRIFVILISKSKYLNLVNELQENLTDCRVIYKK